MANKTRAESDRASLPLNKREVVVGWMKPTADENGLTGDSQYVQEGFTDVKHSEVDEGHLYVEWTDGDITLAPGVWYFVRNFKNGIPAPEPAPPTSA